MQGYFLDMWNVFDCLVVIGSIVDIALSLYSNNVSCFSGCWIEVWDVVI